MTTIISERLTALQTATLDKGSHGSFTEGACAMEWVAYLAGEGHTDAPECASPVLRAFTINLNDQWGQEDRQRLVPYLPRMVGTAGDGQDEERGFLALDWLVRTYTPMWLEVAGALEDAAELREIPPITNLATAEAAGLVVWSASVKARAARESAWAVAGVAARVAAREAAREAAGAAAGVAAREAARESARESAWAAARESAWAAAGEALAPTVNDLKTSALDLLDRMIDPSKAAA